MLAAIRHYFNGGDWKKELTSCVSAGKVGLRINQIPDRKSGYQQDEAVRERIPLHNHPFPGSNLFHPFNSKRNPPHILI